MAGWFNKLRGLLNIEVKPSFPSLTSIFQINIINKSNVASPVTVTENPQMLTVNVDKLSPQQQRDLQPILREAFDAAGAILQDTSRLEIDSFRAAEAEEGYQKQIQIFRDLIPPEDLNLFRACLFLKASYAQGKKIDSLKGQIVRTYGRRGGNLANLCSAGYIDEWLQPLVESLTATERDRAAVVEKFRKMYRNIVDELPWTVFVSRQSTADQVRSEVLSKIEFNLRYGIRWINIHGLGPANVAKIRDTIPAVESAYPGLIKKVVEEGSRICAKLEVPATIQAPGAVPSPEQRREP